MTTYISREEVLDILLKHFGTIDAYEFTKASLEVLSLPSLPDKTSQIKEMIEKKIDSLGMLDYDDRSEIVLEELLTEIESL
jgi:hypothetical protein